MPLCAKFKRCHASALTPGAPLHVRDERVVSERMRIAMGAALRILERHGMLRRDDDRLAATRPEPGVFPVLDVEGLSRRAEVERKKLKTMIEYAYYPVCRRQFVLE